MKLCLIAVTVLGCALTAGLSAQEAPAAPSSSQTPRAGGQGQHGGRGGWGGVFGGNGIAGTVTAVTPGHYTIKTESGESYTIHFSVNTRILKQSIQRERGAAGNGSKPGGSGQGDPEGMGSYPPQTLKPTEIRVGDAIGVMGEVDTAAKSVGAAVIVQIAPERAKMMEAMRANFGTTWLMGKITTIEETKVVLLSSVDNAAHAFMADKNTSLRKRHSPITLADVHVGDIVRVEGAVKDGIFVAASVAVMGAQPGETPTVPREDLPAQEQQTR